LEKVDAHVVQPEEYEELPEMVKEDFDRADAVWRIGGREVPPEEGRSEFREGLRRGRPRSDSAKVSTTIKSIHYDTLRRRRDCSVSCHGSRMADPHERSTSGVAQGAPRLVGPGPAYRHQGHPIGSSRARLRPGQESQNGGRGEFLKSWNSPPRSRGPDGGCSQADLRSTGGDGLFYCFAAIGRR
jgi:hypothetical protein